MTNSKYLTKQGFGIIIMTTFIFIILTAILFKLNDYDKTLCYHTTNNSYSHDDCSYPGFSFAQHCWDVVGIIILVCALIFLIIAHIAWGWGDN